MKKRLVVLPVIAMFSVACSPVSDENSLVTSQSANEINESSETTSSTASSSSHSMNPSTARSEAALPETFEPLTYELVETYPQLTFDQPLHYYGEENPSLTGTYLYGDFVSGVIWALWLDEEMRPENHELLDTDLMISSFGLDEKGELVIVDFGGKIYSLSETDE